MSDAATTAANEFDRSKYVTLREISETCGVMVTLTKLQELGFTPVASVGSAKFFPRAIVPAIAETLAQSIIDKARGWQ